MGKLVKGRPVQADDPELADVVEEDAGPTADEILMNADVGGVEDPELKALANTYIGSYMWNFAGDLFETNVSTEARDILVQISPRGLTVKPQTAVSSEGHTVWSSTYSLRDKLELPVARQILTEMLGEFVAQVDIFQDETLLTNPIVLGSYVPPIREVYDFVENKIGLSHPYSIVLGMRPELRDLPAVAIGNRRKKIGMADNPQYFRTNGSTAIETLDLLAMPTFKEILDVAQKYEITELKPTWEELQRVRKLYNLP